MAQATPLLGRSVTDLSNLSVAIGLHRFHTELLAGGVGEESTEGLEPLVGLNAHMPAPEDNRKSKLPLAADFSARAALFGAEVLREAGDSPDCSDDNLVLFRVTFDLVRRCLLILPRHVDLDTSVEDVGAMTVDLLKSEVSHATIRPGRHVISIVLPVQEVPEGETQPTADDLRLWLLTLDGDDTALLVALDAFSLLGAIRTGLSESFAISSKELGSGGCGTVYLAHKRGGISGQQTPTAVKLAREAGSKADKALLREMPLVVAVQGHENIVRFLGLFRAEDTLAKGTMPWALALELCPGGDLQEMIATRGPQGEAVCSNIMVGVLKAITHVHARNVVHRDVKSENILLAAGGRPVLTDFGVAAFLDDATAMATRCGSAGYVAPEVLKAERKYDSKVDLFGVGVTLYFMFSATLPFVGQDVAQVLRRNARCKISLESSEHFKRIDMWAKNFLILLLQANPDDRPTAPSALMHTWLSMSAKKNVAMPMRHTAAGPVRPATSMKAEENRPKTLEDEEEPEAILRKTAPGGMGRRGGRAAAAGGQQHPVPQRPAGEPGLGRRRWMVSNSQSESQQFACDSEASPSSSTQAPRRPPRRPASGSRLSFSADVDDVDDTEHRVSHGGERTSYGVGERMTHGGERVSHNSESHPQPMAPGQPPPNERGPKSLALGRRLMKPPRQHNPAPNFEMQVQNNNERQAPRRRWRLLGGSFGMGGGGGQNVERPSFDENIDHQSRGGWETLGNVSMIGSGVNTPRTSYCGSVAGGRHDTEGNNGSFLSRGSFSSQRGTQNGRNTRTTSGQANEPERNSRNSRSSFRRIRQAALARGAAAPEELAERLQAQANSSANTYGERSSHHGRDRPQGYELVDDLLDAESVPSVSPPAASTLNSLQRVRRKVSMSGQAGRASSSSSMVARDPNLDVSYDALYEGLDDVQCKSPSIGLGARHERSEGVDHRAPMTQGTGAASGSGRVLSTDSGGSSPLPHGPLRPRKGTASSGGGSGLEEVPDVHEPPPGSGDFCLGDNLEKSGSGTFLSNSAQEKPRGSSWLGLRVTSKVSSTTDKGHANGAHASMPVVAATTPKAAASAASALVEDCARAGVLESSRGPPIVAGMDSFTRGVSRDEMLQDKSTEPPRSSKSLRGRLANVVKGNWGR